MARRKKMNAEEMEKWLFSQGATPVTEVMKKALVCGGVETNVTLNPGGTGQRDVKLLTPFVSGELGFASTYIP